MFILQNENLRTNDSLSHALSQLLQNFTKVHCYRNFTGFQHVGEITPYWISGKDHLVFRVCDWVNESDCVIGWKNGWVLNRFNATGLFLYPLKISENLRFSNVSGGVERDKRLAMGLNNFSSNSIIVPT